MWFHNCQISVLPAHVLFGKVPPLINSYTQEHPFSGKPARIPLKQSWHPWAREQQNSAQQKSWSSTMICWPHFLTPPPSSVQWLQLCQYKSFRRMDTREGRSERWHKTQGYWLMKKNLELETRRKSRNPSLFQDGALITLQRTTKGSCLCYPPARQLLPGPCSKPRFQAGAFPSALGREIQDFQASSNILNRCCF